MTTFFCAVGSIEAVFPGLLWGLLGEDYGSFEEAWGACRGTFEVLTLGSLAVVIVLALAGYRAAKGVRERSVEISLDHSDQR